MRKTKTNLFLLPERLGLLGSGSLGLSLTEFFASLSKPLAEAKIRILYISTMGAIIFSRRKES